MRMNFLSDLDGDEVSLVRRAANRRRFLLLKGDSDLDSELADILEVPWEREGALLDEIRKEGIQDETVEKAVVAAVRLLKGVESEFSPELIEKLGGELYGRSNPVLNTGSGQGNGGQLGGSASGEDDHFGGASGASKDGSGRGSSLEGSGSAPKVAEDQEPDEPDDDEDDIKKKKKRFMRKKSTPDVAKSDDSDINDEMSAIEDEGGAVDFRVPVKKEDGTWDYTDVPEEARGFFAEMIEKADRAEKDLEDARIQLTKAAEDRRHRDSVEKAASYSHVAPTDDLAPILKEASEKLDAETVEKLESLLEVAEERITKGDLFKEMGRRSLGEGPKSDSYSEAVKKADELIEKSDKPLTSEQAIAKVYEANPELYAQYLAENGMGAS